MRGDKRFACECFMRMYGFRRCLLLNLNKKDHVASHENIDEANLVEADNLGSVCGYCNELTLRRIKILRPQTSSLMLFGSQQVSSPKICLTNGFWDPGKREQ